MDHEPTHHLPDELQRKLVKAKEWYDQRDLDAMTSDQAQASDRQGAYLMMDVIEIIEQTWGFAKPLPHRQDAS